MTKGRKFLPGKQGVDHPFKGRTKDPLYSKMFVKKGWLTEEGKNGSTLWRHPLEKSKNGNRYFVHPLTAVTENADNI
jgi:hypothetical protein